jgi:outer membrane protein TolC
VAAHIDLPIPRNRHTITLTDVLDADRDLLTAQDQLASAKALAVRSAVASYRALGGGWSA